MQNLKVADDRERNFRVLSKRVAVATVAKATASIGQAESVARALEAPEDALEGDFVPVLILVANLQALVFRDPISGWSHTAPREVGEPLATCHSLSPRQDGENLAKHKARAILTATIHAVQNAYEVIDGETGEDNYASLADHLEGDALSDFQSWVGFQRAYRFAEANHPGDSHRWAGTNVVEFRPNPPTPSEVA